jgi:hypothetical protein
VSRDDFEIVPNTLRIYSNGKNVSVLTTYASEYIITIADNNNYFTVLVDSAKLKAPCVLIYYRAQQQHGVIRSGRKVRNAETKKWI